MNDGEGEEDGMKEKEVFEAQRTALFYTPAPGQYLQNRWSKKLNHTSVIEKAIHFQRKGPSLSEATDNVDDDASGEVDSTHP